MCQRVEIVEGDLTKPDLGLNGDDRRLLAARVNLVIHCASPINLAAAFDKISPAVVDATRYLGRLALTWPQVDCFVYVSTAYCNAHLHRQNGGLAEVEVDETLYPLENEPAKADITATFLWDYAYAKHQAEKCLDEMFQPSPKRLLIVRPSIIGPAQCFPYPQFCHPMSSPVLTATAALCLDRSASALFASAFPEPEVQATFDVISVDTVVDRLLFHVAMGSEGVVHAVRGLGPNQRITFKLWWEAMLRLRAFSRPLALKFRSPPADPDAQEELHRVARLMKIAGMSFRFSQRRTELLLAAIPEGERAALQGLQLFAEPVNEAYDMIAGKRQLWHCISRFTRKSLVDRLMAMLLYGHWALHRPDRREAVAATH